MQVAAIAEIFSVRGRRWVEWQNAIHLREKTNGTSGNGQQSYCHPNPLELVGYHRKADGKVESCTMWQAADPVLDALRDGKTIGIIGDYDCDGITSTAELSAILKTMSHEYGEYFEAGKKHPSSILSYIPKRKEGHGIGIQAVEEMHANGASVLLIPDSGVASKEALQRARELGMTTIVLDHHEPDEHPDCHADYVFDPKLVLPKVAPPTWAKKKANSKHDGNPYMPHAEDFTGAGLSWLFAETLVVRAKRRMLRKVIGGNEATDKVLTEILGEHAEGQLVEAITPETYVQLRDMQLSSSREYQKLDKQKDGALSKAMEHNAHCMEALQSLLTLAAIGTVGDVGDISTPYNAWIVQEGFRNISDARRYERLRELLPGLTSLLDELEISDDNAIKAIKVGRDSDFAVLDKAAEVYSWRFVPLVNAANRIGDILPVEAPEGKNGMVGMPSLPLRVISHAPTANPEQLQHNMQKMIALNEKRKEVVHKMEFFLRIWDPYAPVLIADIPGEIGLTPEERLLWGTASETIGTEGLVGLLAGNLARDFGRPAMVFSLNWLRAMPDQDCSLPHENYCIDEVTPELLPGDRGRYAAVASCRGPDRFSFAEFIRAARKEDGLAVMEDTKRILDTGGGHVQAAGASILDTELENMHQRLAILDTYSKKHARETDLNISPITCGKTQSSSALLQFLECIDEECGTVRINAEKFRDFFTATPTESHYTNYPLADVILVPYGDDGVSGQHRHHFDSYFLQMYVPVPRGTWGKDLTYEYLPVENLRIEVEGAAVSDLLPWIYDHLNEPSTPLFHIQKTVIQPIDEATHQPAVTRTGKPKKEEIDDHLTLKLVDIIPGNAYERLLEMNRDLREQAQSKRRNKDD